MPEPFAHARDPVQLNQGVPAAPPEADSTHVRLALNYSEQRFPKLYKHNAAAFHRVLTEFCKNNRQRIEREFRQGDIFAFKDIAEQVAAHCRATGARDYSVPEEPGPGWVPLSELPHYYR